MNELDILKELITLYNTHLQISHALWSFIITAYLGVLGFVYASDNISKSVIAKSIITILCLMLAGTNYTSIQRSQDVMIEANASISKEVLKQNIKDTGIVLPISKFRASNKEMVFRVHAFMDLFVIFGIWLQDIVIIFRRKEKVDTPVAE